MPKPRRTRQLQPLKATLASPTFRIYRSRGFNPRYFPTDYGAACKAYAASLTATSSMGSSTSSATSAPATATVVASGTKTPIGAIVGGGACLWISQYAQKAHATLFTQLLVEVQCSSLVGSYSSSFSRPKRRKRFARPTFRSFRLQLRQSGDRTLHTLNLSRRRGLARGTLPQGCRTTEQACMPLRRYRVLRVTKSALSRWCRVSS
jgi:hypothetical protein